MRRDDRVGCHRPGHNHRTPVCLLVLQQEHRVPVDPGTRTGSPGRVRAYHPPMVRHVVLLTFQPNTPRADLGAVAGALRTLPGRIPELRGYSVGVDLGLAGADGGNADLSIVADVDDVAGYEAYRDHPEHQRIIAEMIRPILASRVAVQHER